jgi:hypothetical protein
MLKGISGLQTCGNKMRSRQADRPNAGGFPNKIWWSVMTEHSSIDAVTEITDGLYLGTVAYAQSLQFENPFNIEMVVNLCEDAVPVSAGMTVEWLPVSDGEAVPADIIAKGLSAIERTLSHGRRVLVACRAGQSRSASMVIGYLRLQSYDWDTAYRLVAEKRWISPHPRTLRSVKEFVDDSLKVP